MDGNRRNYATLDEAMESHVFTGRNVTNKPTDEEIEEADRICLNCKYNFLHWSKKPCINCQNGELWEKRDGLIPPKEKSNN